MRMQLEGLTPRQAEICDMLWACDSMEEVKFLLDYCLTEDDRAMAVTLLEVMHVEAAEAQGALEEVKPIVDDLLDRIMRNV
jgi:hypothetical protein